MSDDKREMPDQPGQTPSHKAVADVEALAQAATPADATPEPAEPELAAEATAAEAALAAEVAELKDKLLRALAELENVRRRGARERDDALKYGTAEFARDICEVADNLGRALDSAPSDAADDLVINGLLDGVRMTETALLNAFARHGISRLDPAGERFDPNRHEAMTEIETGDVAPGAVAQVVQTGYMIHDRLLRPARVIVARAPKDAAPSVDTKA